MLRVSNPDIQNVPEYKLDASEVQISQNLLKYNGHAQVFLGYLKVQFLDSNHMCKITPVCF